MAKTKWLLDPMHSELQFKIKHLMISNVSGYFKNFSADVTTEDEDFSSAQINLIAQMASVSTNNEQRDEHLRTSDFFGFERLPELSFTSTKIEVIDNENFSLLGNLTLKGVTNPVKLTVEYSGVTKDPWGGERAGFLVTGKINRSDWGVSFNGVMETGGVVLSEEVRIKSELQLVKQAVEELV